MKKILLLALITAAFFSCGKHAMNDETDPTIELLSPLEGQNCKIGDSVRIKGKMWDNNDLHEASIMVTEKMGGMKMDCPMHVHEHKEYSFDTCYIVKPADANGLKITVKAEDHSENSTEKTVNLNVN